jgi:hypothetical protein
MSRLVPVFCKGECRQPDYDGCRRGYRDRVLDWVFHFGFPVFGIHLCNSKVSPLSELRFDVMAAS